MEKDDYKVKIFITFGSDALPELKHVLNPMIVMLVVSGESMADARDKVFKSFIGDKFCTSYPYDRFADEYKTKYGMKEHTLEELEYLVEVQNYFKENA